MNAEVGGATSIELAADVEAPGRAIAKVEFLDSGRAIGSAMQPPFKLADCPDKAQLNYCSSARAIDIAGGFANSPPVTCVASSQRKIDGQALTIAGTVDLHDQRGHQDPPR
jgi:hypothetical protein